MPPLLRREFVGRLIAMLTLAPAAIALGRPGPRAAGGARRRPPRRVYLARGDADCLGITDDPAAGAGVPAMLHGVVGVGRDAGGLHLARGDSGVIGIANGGVGW